MLFAVTCSGGQQCSEDFISIVNYLKEVGFKFIYYQQVYCKGMIFMTKVALLSCTSSKKSFKCEARELYSESPRFRRSFMYAKLVADKVYILSAKHGLVAEDTMIEPYNETIKEKGVQERRIWAESIIHNLKEVSDLEQDEYIIIAGEAYNQYLLPHLKAYWLPLKGKALGEWIPGLDRLIQSEKISVSADALHRLLNSLPRLDWNMISNIPYQNGIYIMFEKGQSYHGMDRIVRVGTHRAQDRLKARLKDHFVKEDANGSIFRKNIGRAFLKMTGDSYLKIWELDTSKTDVARDNAHLIDEQKESKLETRISDYLRENITFVCFPVKTEVERLRLEEGIISTLNKQQDFDPSDDWLGLQSPISEIRDSALWNRQGLDGQPLSEDEFESVKWLARFGDHSNGVLPEIKHQAKRTTRQAIETEKFSTTRKKTANDVRKYIEQLLNEAKLRGEKYLDLVSGQIHKELGMQNRMPQVCRIMYEKMGASDEILHTTPSGNSSTIKIRFQIA